MNNISAGTYEFDFTKDSLNEKGITYVCSPPTTYTKFGLNKISSHYKIGCIINGNNTTVNQFDLMVHNLINFSAYESGFCPNLT